MKRDIEKIRRNLEDKTNTDIIVKKEKLMNIFKSDPDLLEVLGQREKLPLNKYNDSNNPTEEELAERKRILEYNLKTETEQIVPFLKLNGLQKEVSNFVMYEIQDKQSSFGSSAVKNQYLTVMCLVHEDDMETEYNIVRTDLLDYIIKDLLCWTNELGMHLVCINDTPSRVDEKYYCRTLVFENEAPNTVRGHMGINNKRDYGNYK